MAAFCYGTGEGANRPYTIIKVNQSILDDVVRQQKAVNLGKTGGVLTWPSILRRVHKKDASFAS